MLNDVVILIPCHSLEDFPTDLGEKPAEGLINAFVVAWHPWLLAQTRSLPGWHRADSPPEPSANRLILVPTVCEEQLAGDWISQQREAGSHVVAGLHKRADLLDAVLAASRDWKPRSDNNQADGACSPSESLPAETMPNEPALSPDQLDPELVADFLSLGLTYLLVELLSRQMHYFGEIDEIRLRREAVEAAEALIAGRTDMAKTRLAACFETLHEARERFYPVDAYLIDMCLLVPDMAKESLTEQLVGDKPISLLMTARDAEQIANEKPDIARLIREAVQRGTVEILGGEWAEVASPVVPLESLLHDLRRGQATCQRLFGQRPTTWARRRFGLSPMLPQILGKFGYTAACHFLLDDGLYPDAEYSKLRWEGCDSSTIDAISRLPLAADSSTSYLRLPQRMAESMQQDQGAGLILARWPDVRSPFFHDLVRATRYSPVIGRFATAREFFERTDSPMRHTRYEAGEYLAPFLTRSVAGREPNPISRFIEHFHRRQRLDSAAWLNDMATVLRGQRLQEHSQSRLEQRLEQAAIDAERTTDRPASQPSELDSTGEVNLEQAIRELADTGQKELSRTILNRTSEKTPGVLVINTLSFTRRVPVAWPASCASPALGGAVKGVSEIDGVLEALIEVPGSGFVWLPAPTDSGRTNSGSAAAIKTPMVEDNVLRNEFFEVHISPVTGGIQRFKEYGRKPNRLSQQLAFRFPRERTITVQEDESVFEEKTFYAETRCRGIEVVSRGPWLGVVRTEGEIVDQKTDAVLATFRQTFRLWRGRRTLDIDIELDQVKVPEGEPWTNYFGVRWAWLDTTAVLTRSVLGAAQPIGHERFESPHYLEIADDDSRTTILMHGLPFHRKTGRRMCDSLLIVEGETRRRFQFSVAFENPYPLQAAWDAMVPAVVIPTELGPPRGGTSGWFFHVDSPDVQVTRLTDLMDEPRGDAPAWDRSDATEPAAGQGFAVRLQETEGRHQSLAFRCFQTPLSVRQRDFIGRTSAQPKIEGDAVRLTLSPFEITDLELRFDPPANQNLPNKVAGDGLSRNFPDSN